MVEAALLAGKQTLERPGAIKLFVGRAARLEVVYADLLKRSRELTAATLA